MESNLLSMLKDEYINENGQLDLEYIEETAQDIAWSEEGLLTYFYIFNKSTFNTELITFSKSENPMVYVKRGETSPLTGQYFVKRYFLPWKKFDHEMVMTSSHPFNAEDPSGDDERMSEAAAHQRYLAHLIEMFKKYQDCIHLTEEGE